MEPSVRFVDDIKPLLESSLQRVRGVEGVKWAVPLYKGNARAKLVFSPTEMKERTYPAVELRARSADRPEAPGQSVHRRPRSSGTRHRFPGRTAGPVVRRPDHQRDRAGDLDRRR